MPHNNSERYVCRFCAAGAASGENANQLFYNCHVCKAPKAMIPVTMHRELINLVVQNDVLMAKLDQIHTLLREWKTQGAKPLKMNVGSVMRVLKDQSAFDSTFQAVRTEPEPAVNEDGDPVHFRTYLNRLIDKCPEAVQKHIWELREDSDTLKGEGPPIDLQKVIQDAFTEGCDFGIRSAYSHIKAKLGAMPGAFSRPCVKASESYAATRSAELSSDGNNEDEDW